MPAAIAGVRALGFAGACITVPYKVASIPFLDEVDADVQAIGAANYMTIEAGRLIGHNNDGKGVVKAIRKGHADRRASEWPCSAPAVPGGPWPSSWPGPELSHLTLITRRQAQGEEVAATVTRASGVPAVWQPWVGEVGDPCRHPDPHERHPSGLCARAGIRPARIGTRSPPATTLVDVITNPRITPFLQTAQDKGCPIVDGVDMLVQLAMQIFSAWTGIAADEAVFQRAVAQALGEMS